MLESRTTRCDATTARIVSQRTWQALAAEGVAGPNLPRTCQAEHARLRTGAATLVAAVVLFGASAARGEDGSSRSLRADAPYSAAKSEPVTHAVDFSVVVTPPYHCRVLKVWVPVPRSDAGQTIQEGQFSTFPLEVTPRIHTEPVYGNRFAYFEFHKPHGAQIIRHRFQAKVWNLNWNLDAGKVTDVDGWPEAFEPYLQTRSLADKGQFQLVLKQVVPQRLGIGRDLTSIMRWIDANLKYDHVNASLRADPNHALVQRRGHCSDYHGLCATMGRALGYPTRVTYGLALYPKNSPSHCKMEAFLPPYGWVSFDLSETQKLVKKIRTDDQLAAEFRERLAAAANERLLSGFRENSWLLLTKGTDYELAPKASGPVRVVRTAYVEADGEPLPDPDPANIEKREFAWMTLHKYDADQAFKLPFKDWSTLPVASGSERANSSADAR